MKKYNPVNLDTKAELELATLVEILNPNEDILLLSSNLWFDEITGVNGNTVDTYDAMDEYSTTFTDISKEITQLINEEPKYLTWDNEQELEAYSELDFYPDFAYQWNTNKLALFYCHEDKELPITIILLKQ